MIPVAKLRRKPRHFHAFPGVRVSEFDQRLAQVAPAYEAPQQQAKPQADRKRQPGAGRRFPLGLPERLLMGVLSLRL